MPGALRRALLACVAALLLAAAAPGLAAAAWLPVSVTGTYELLAKDVAGPDGTLTHVYSDVLRVPGRAIPLRLPAGHGLRGGTRVRMSALRTGGGTAYDVRSYEQLSPASVAGSNGTTSVIVLLAYWTAPDAVTQARATSQIFGDDDRWFREVSYGKAGLAGVVTPWLRVPAPAGGKCFAGAEALLAAARAKAAALGGVYDPYAYQRTIVYFPRCAGGDTAGFAGWAYEPGSVSWLNGAMDRRTSVHEQGHNYGLGHARSYACKNSAGTRVTLSGTCSASEYGDPYDAMGRSAYAGHYTGYRKDRLGWLGSRKRVLTTSSASFTLPPFEKPSTLPLVVVAKSPASTARSYWLEYRRPVGFDAKLPAGATGGVLVHLVDSGRPGYLLDGTPLDKTMSTAVLKPGTSWTAPDKVKISVGALSSTGVKVSVSGARPAPKPPTAPLLLAARQHDGVVDLTWSPPSSQGGGPVTAYEINATSAEDTVVRMVDGVTHTVWLTSLHPGVRYTVTVRARNVGGLSPPATTYVTPYVLNPTVTLTSPAPGAVVSGVIEVDATAAPHPAGTATIYSLVFSVDGVPRGEWYWGGTGHAMVDTTQLPNGTHAISVVATDTSQRTASATRVVTFRNPLPEVAITSPAPGARIDTETVSLDVTASVPLDPSATVTSVQYVNRTGWGYDYPISPALAAPFHYDWKVSDRSGQYTIVALARTSAGLTAWSAPVDVVVEHPPSTVVVTTPAPGGTVSGASTRVAADATVVAPGVGVAYVAFADTYGEFARDYDAPYEATWDISRRTGGAQLVATLHETSGRTATGSSWVTVANALPQVTVASVAGPREPGLVPLRGTATASAGGAAPERVVVSVGGEVVGEAPVVDGVWSYDWDSGTSFGYQSFGVESVTPGGLVSPSAWAAVSITRPAPVVTVESPAQGQVVRPSSAVEVVVSAAPGAKDPTTILRACVGMGWGWPTCAPRSSDGRFHVPVSAPYYTGTYPVQVSLQMSDGATLTASPAPSTLIVANPPAAPSLSWTTSEPNAITVTVAAPVSYSEPVPITGYVVSVGSQTATLAAPGSVTFTSLASGGYVIAANAVNAAGDGARRAISVNVTWASEPAPATAAFAPLGALPLTTLGRRRRAAARP